MKPACLIILIGALGLLNIAHAEQTPRSAMRAGIKAYNAGDYTNAVTHFEKTALEFPGEGHFNLGNSYYNLGEYKRAAEEYVEAQRTTDVELQAKIYFNHGNALLASTTKLSKPEEINQAIGFAFEAMGMFERSLMLQPDDLAAKQSYERAQMLRLSYEYRLGRMSFDEAEELLTQFKAKEAKAKFKTAEKQFRHILDDVDPQHAETKHYSLVTKERLTMLATALSATEAQLAAAEQYVADYQYSMAAELLAKQTDQTKYAFSLKPDLKKNFEQVAQKNQQILKIIKEMAPKTSAEQ